MRSLEDMAKTAIEMYMKPYPEFNFAGHTLEAATRKAKANHPNWVKVIDQVSARMGK